MLLVTGGAGFIGSNVVASLNDRGRTDVAISDRLETRPAASRLDPLAPFIHIDEWRLREGAAAR